MPRVSLGFLFSCLAALSLPAGGAFGAPIARPADLTLQLSLPGWGVAFELTGAANVQVDEMAATLSIPASALLQTGPLSQPVTVTTAAFAVSAVDLALGAGTFGPGEATGDGACPPGPGNEACVAADRFGGSAPVLGTLLLRVLPRCCVTVPVDLAAARAGVGGPGTNTAFTSDAAPWTLGSAALAFSKLLAGGAVTSTFAGTVRPGAGRLSMVSPVFVKGAGFDVSAVHRLTIEFRDGEGLPAFLSAVPEPGAALLLALALAAGLSYRGGGEQP